MKNRKLFLLMIALLSPCFALAQKNKVDTRQVEQLIERNLGYMPSNIKLKVVDKVDGRDQFSQQVKGDKLLIWGSSGVALSRGFYDFMSQNSLGQSSWSGSRFDIPDSFAGLDTRSVTSPVEHHYYLNVVTYGYTTPYWDWAQWEQEIDWMALHGIDMPLALVATEAISVRVWKRLGLTDQEISDYLVGPAHFPWMRMGNISQIDSPLPQSWHDDQVELQHKILDRMRGLNMTPICPGFAGFVPKAITRLYPDAQIVETSWGGAFHNWMISPESELFTTIAKMYIEEWEAEFGRNSHYLVDSFNEMEIPFPPKGTAERYDLLRSYGEKVYHSISESSPDAVWVMQGWMFGYQRDIWDYETLAALVSSVPDDKILLLDLAADYNAHWWHSSFNWDFYKGFYDKNWVYSVIPNMGGKTGHTGVLDFYANGHLAALESENRGNLLAIGMAPEGVENNEVIYELLTDAAWSDQHIDVEQWLERYSLARYGTYNPTLALYWQKMLSSVYGTFTDHPRYNWQFRPGTVSRGSINVCGDYFAALESFASLSEGMIDNPTYFVDLCENMALYLGAKLEIVTQAIYQAMQVGDRERSLELQGEFERLALLIDQFLDSHPTLRLERWLDFASAHGTTDQERDYYQKNARRIVTVWGPPVDDYSARVWSGLVRDYYLPRWQEYFVSANTGESVDLAAWELRWVEEQRGVSSVDYSAITSDLVADVISSVSYITPSMIEQQAGLVSVLTSDSDEACQREVGLSAGQLQDAGSIVIEYLRGGATTIASVVLELDGVEVLTQTVDKVLSYQEASYTLVFDEQMSRRANNGARLLVCLSGVDGDTSSVSVFLK
ncbi:MAG: alpha-N-acetylglucosaminidase [Rikenellaceae bacterium]